MSLADRDRENDIKIWPLVLFGPPLAIIGLVGTAAVLALVAVSKVIEPITDRRHMRQRAAELGQGEVDPLTLPADTLVDVLYGDELTYRTVMRGHVDWHNPRHMPALWHVHEPE